MRNTGGCHCGTVSSKSKMTVDKLYPVIAQSAQAKGHLLGFTEDKNLPCCKGKILSLTINLQKMSIIISAKKRDSVGSVWQRTIPDSTKMQRSTPVIAWIMSTLKQFSIVGTMEKAYRSLQSPQSSAKSTDGHAFDVKWHVPWRTSSWQGVDRSLTFIDAVAVDGF